MNVTRKPRNGRAKYNCEFCGKLKMHTTHNTVCEQCDNNLIRQEIKFQAEQAKPTKRRCRTCDEFLPRTRYFDCLKCVPEYDTEDPYLEQVPCYGTYAKLKGESPDDMPNL
jgi:hypothetical protein